MASLPPAAAVCIPAPPPYYAYSCSSCAFASLPSSSLLSPICRPSVRRRAAQAQVPPMSDFDTAAFEADRLRLDAQARQEMVEVAEAAEEEEEASLKESSNGDAETGGSADRTGEDSGAWKWAIRKRIWDFMERENIAVHPRPVHHRIPNFRGAATAAAKLASLPAFQASSCVKVNPDTPQKQVRYLTLQGNKKLLTPQPRLRTGFFSELEAASIPPDALEEACTALGVAKYGKPLGLDANLKVDLIVIGSVAVDPKTGARLGKGEGFAELEYGMLRHMGAIDDSTLVVTSVHDKQLVNDIPVEKLKVHDVPVDVICTPTHVIYTNTTISKPKGIYWELLSPEKLGQILVLQQLKKQIEKETGTKLPTGSSEKLPPTAQRSRRKKPLSTRQPEGGTTVKESSSEPCIFVWNLDIGTTWKEVKEYVIGAGAEVVRVNMLRRGSNRPMARIYLKEGVDVEGLVKSLDGSSFGKTALRAKVNEESDLRAKVNEANGKE